MVKEYCKLRRFDLNNTQLGLTLLLVCNLVKFCKRKQLLLLPSGLGKSRVIFGLIVCLVLGKRQGSSFGQADLKEVEVVYNHQA